MPLKNNQTSYQRLQEDLDYRLDRMNQAREAAFNAVNQPTTSPSSNSKSVVRRQQQLRKMGFYKGKIDGDWGSGSRRAHKAALANGYILNSHGMYVKKPQAQTRVTPKAYTQTEQRQAQLKQLGFYNGKIDDNFGPKSRAAHQAALDAGYEYKNGEYVSKYKPTQVRDGHLGQGDLDSIYPYDWVDANDNSRNLFAMTGKALKGALNIKSNDRKLFDEFVELDLSTPEGLTRAKEMAPNFGNLVRDRNGNNVPIDNALVRYMQKSMRSRKDLLDLYAGKPQTYNTFMINPDYQSPTAKEAGVPTYTYRDPEMRRAWQKETANYMANDSVTPGNHIVVGDTFNELNNHTIHKNPDGSGHVGDVWDFKQTVGGVTVFPDLPNSNKVIVGDTIPAGMGVPNGYTRLHTSPKKQSSILEAGAYTAARLGLTALNPIGYLVHKLKK